ncbi:MAG: DUF885 domain-containing protein [Gammaproteobacteria bacterium]
MRSVKMLLLAGAAAWACLGVAQAADQNWVAQSNRNAQVLLKLMAEFAPEQAGQLGVDGLDDKIFDLRPGVYERSIKALRKADAELKSRLADTRQPQVRQDLEILIKTTEGLIKTNQLQHQYLLPYFNVSQTVFFGLRSLLDPQIPAERQKAAVTRLKLYAGMGPADKPITELARDRFSERLSDKSLIGPYDKEVEQDLKDSKRYIAGIKALFEKSDLKGWQAPYAKLAGQLADYDAWVRSTVLAHARKNNTLPEAIYADNLHQFGVDMDPRALMQEAMFSFNEIQHQMQALAPLVAREKGFKSTDYRDVIRELKKDQIEGDDVLPFYKKRLAQIEAIIRRERIVTLPKRDVKIRMASEAETAAIPAPHMQPPRLIGNTGQYGEFVLPANVPSDDGKSTMKFDDDSFDAAAWTLTAHEARPGHELQFSAMIEQGVSITRAVFAFNSANVEGWALYAEAEMQPYEPLDGQLITLQNRLLRAARAFLDPMLNLGMIKPEEVNAFLQKEVVLSPAFAKEETDRFAFRMPGQATSYYYGYHNLMTIRAEAQIKLGDKFDRMKFNDFVLSQGLLPPDLMREAVEKDFIPSQM